MIQYLKHIGGASLYERIKLVCLTSSFFCIIGCYTILRELRDSLFVATVGCAYIQYAQIVALFCIVPLLFLYSRMVDQYTKYQLMYGCSLVYGIGGVIIAGLLGHDTIGLAQSVPSVWRILGWFLYVFIEGYTAFVVSLFLAIVNSVTPPRQAPQIYSIVVAGSKLGGMTAAAGAWWFLTITLWSSVVAHQVLVLFASFLILLVPFLIMVMRAFVPEAHLHGYEASYQAEKKQEAKGLQLWYHSIFAGPRLMFKYPYVLGIFFLASLWGLISIVINCHRLQWCVVENRSVIALSGVLFKQVLWSHVIGLFISLIGVRLCLRYLGERWSLLLVPLMTGGLLFVYFLNWYASLAYIFVRALNYSMAVSLRETLYIPTSKEVRFKSKSWTDAFGIKFAGGLGALYAIATAMGSTNASSQTTHIIFCGCVMVVWAGLAYYLGNRFERAIRHNEVIGVE